MKTEPRHLPHHLPLSCLLLIPAAALSACGTSPPPSPPAVTTVQPPDRSADTLRFFGGGDLYVVYAKDSSGLPVTLLRTTRDPGTALEPFLTDPTAIRHLDCLRLSPAQASQAGAETGPQAGLCHPALWRDWAAAGTSSLATAGDTDTLVRLTDSALSQVRQAMSGLTGTPPEARTNPADPALPPLSRAARHLLPLLAQSYAHDRTTALGGAPDDATTFLQAYPTAPEPDRKAVTDAALHRTLSRPHASAGELRRVLRVLPLTADQKAQGLDALRRLQSLDGWLSALRLGGSVDDLQQAKALAARTPERNPPRKIEESLVLDRALQTPGATDRLFRLTPPSGWELRQTAPDSTGTGTASLSGPVTVAALPDARLRSGTYAVTVRISAASTRTYIRQTTLGETVQATAHSTTETETVFTLSPPAYRQSQQITLPGIPSPGTGTAQEGFLPVVTLRVVAVDLNP